MSVLSHQVSPVSRSGMRSFISTASKYERIPFASSSEKATHERTRRAQGWEATYEWEATDGQRDLYYITLTKLES